MTKSIKQAPCSNCLEALCEVCSDEISTVGHPLAHLHHKEDGTKANEHCTRNQVVMVKGCGDCWLMNDDPHGDYADCGHEASPSDNDVRPYTLNADHRPAHRPGWCPLTDDDGKPTQGVTLRALREVEG